MIKDLSKRSGLGAVGGAGGDATSDKMVQEVFNKVKNVESQLQAVNDQQRKLAGTMDSMNKDMVSKMDMDMVSKMDIDSMKKDMDSKMDSVKKDILAKITDALKQ